MFAFFTYKSLNLVILVAGEAIEKLKAGHFVYREGWNGKEQWLFYEADFHCQTGYVKYDLQPFIMLRTTQATFIPWTVSQSDALAEDWVVQKPETDGE